MILALDVNIQTYLLTYLQYKQYLVNFKNSLLILMCTFSFLF